VIIGDIDLYTEKKRVHWRAGTSDGTRWLHQSLDTPAARDIAHGAGRFVVVGPGGLIESSHDGQTWARHEIAETGDLSHVVWTGQRFLVSGGKQTWSSPDALTWQPEAGRLPGSLAWAREPLRLGLGVSWGGNLHVSSDLATWKKVALSPGPSLNAIAAREP